MSSHVWGSSDTDDGSIEYVSVTPETLEGGMNVMRNSFLLYEKVCIGVELPQHPKAREELEELFLRSVRDGVSVVAIEKSTAVVVGAAFNKLQVKADDQTSYFEQYKATCKYASSKSLVQFMIDADAVVDLFDVSKANCLLEIMFLAVLPEFGGRGIARKLWEVSMQLGRALMSGKNIKVAVDDACLPIEPVPTVMSAICSSIITQNLAKKLGFVQVAEISYEKLSFEGETFASRIGPDTTTATVVYKPL